MERRLYAAYGSNLNFAQMRLRCPTAKFVGSGMAEGYRLCFKGGFAAVATIEEENGLRVPVGVWDIQPDDERMLDSYEGYPRLYQKKDIEIVMDAGPKLTAMAYTIDPRLVYGNPSAGYFEAILEGYKNCGLDSEYLYAASAFSAEKAEENQLTLDGFIGGFGGVMDGGRVDNDDNDEGFFVEDSYFTFKF